MAERNEVMDKPCKGCTDRRADPNCHIDCERYLAYLEGYRAWKDKVYEGRMDAAVFLSPSVKHRNKQRKERERYERNK